jgi:hypothetical protein
MADSTPNPPGNDPKKKRKSPGPIDGRLLKQVGNDKDSIDALLDEIGKDAQLGTDLGSHFIDADGDIPMTVPNLKLLSEAAAAAAAAGASAVDETADLRDITTEERDAFDAAVAAIHRVQQAAKEKYEENHKEKLGAYYVGQPLDTLTGVKAAGAAVWGKVGNTDANDNPITPNDTLPGFSAAKIAQLKTDLGAYAGIQTTQSGAQSQATEARGTFKTQCDQVHRRHRRVLIALDGERPYTADSEGRDNTALRKRIGLPADKTFS